ncbi:CHAT domain-containing protein [Streptomyces sp. B93]|uniref:CHAT domain-containing protein n=1 Tax=Streptomyces sp. B93 TaxID=2824875 RepID=UPI001B380A70|nr:CHAT domain-containing protein [Streptomyces sp. B93]MBQ1094254.1 CHAT domain-containing protein [Streptomyces sp. B93]
MNDDNIRNELIRIRRAQAEAEQRAQAYRSRETEQRGYASQARKRAEASGRMADLPSAATHHTRQADAAAENAEAWERTAAERRMEAARMEERLAAHGQPGPSRGERRGPGGGGRVPAPASEKLRVLWLGAGPEGDLRGPREQDRIREAVHAATHRDRVVVDAHPAATAAHLLTQLPRFRPHVVHFSGHGNEDELFFEENKDVRHYGVPVKAQTFTDVLAAVDEPPQLVLLLACDSAAQAEKLTGTVPFAIGMTGEIDDETAINYAARFYATLCEGQSLRAAHNLAKVALRHAEFPDHDAPVMFHAPHADPARAVLVSPPNAHE